MGTTFATIGFLIAAEGFFIFLSCRPLWHTDLWGHLSYGREIVENGRLPDTEPLMTLSVSRPFVDTAWLSQVIGYTAIRAWGANAIQFLYAASVTFCAVLLAWSAHSRTGKPAVGLIAAAVFVWVGWQHLLIVRPQLAGLACFMLLFVWLTSKPWNRAMWFAVPGLFALWANLHGSFPTGLVLLGCFLTGRGLDLLRRHGRASILLHDRKLKRYAALLLLAFAATLLNPYGWDLHAEIVAVSRHPNLADLVEWKPLRPGMRQAVAAGIVAFTLLMLYRLRRRRASFVEVVMLAVFGAATLWVSRMIIWWAPLAGYCVALQTGAVWSRCAKRIAPRWRPSAPSWCSTVANGMGFPRPKGVNAAHTPPSAGIRKNGSRMPPRWTPVAAAAALIVAGIGCTPFGRMLVSGRQPPLRESVSARTPVAAARFLSTQRPSGLIFNTYEWGDYLIWAGGGKLQVFVASHAHLIPVDVWQDYTRVSRVRSGWDEVLDRYRVDTVVLDAARHRRLAGQLRTHAEWEVRYDDGVGVIFARRR